MQTTLQCQEVNQWLPEGKPKKAASSCDKSAQGRKIPGVPGIVATVWISQSTCILKLIKLSSLPWCSSGQDFTLQYKEPSFNPCQGTRSHMLQQRLKISQDATKAWCSQINKKFLKSL